MVGRHPPQPVAEGEVGLKDMVIFTQGPRDYWPADRIPWLQDAYPVPYFVKEMQRKEAEAGAEVASAGAKQ